MMLILKIIFYHGIDTNIFIGSRKPLNAGAVLYPVYA